MMPRLAALVRKEPGAPAPGYPPQHTPISVSRKSTDLLTPEPSQYFIFPQPEKELLIYCLIIYLEISIKMY
jgi:hypothetical protein